MKKYPKNIKFAFLFALIIISLTLALGIYIVKDNFYFSAQCIKMNFNYLKYETKAIAQSAKVSKTDETIIIKSIPVIFYHGVVKESDGENITIKKLREQLFSLKENGYQTITIKDFYDFINGKKRLSGKLFLLAYDGGRKDAYYYADPLLKALGYSAVMFMPTDYIGDSKFYLSADDLKRMAGNGRWEIQSGASKPNDLGAINANGEKGYSLSNKLYFKKQGVLETNEEFKKRIGDDLLISEKKLTDLMGIKPVAFSLPISAFGGNSINYKESKEVVLDSAKNIFDLTFSEFWPRNKSGFLANYPKTNSIANKSLKGIIVNLEWSGEDLVKILGRARSLELPYQEEFVDANSWNTISGAISLKDKKLIISNDQEGIANVYLEGSEEWKNYEYDFTINGGLKDGITLSLLSRSDNHNNYVSCQFEKNLVAIKSSDNGQATILNSVKILNRFTKASNNVKMIVYDDLIKCLINDESIAQTKNPQASNQGGVGIKVYGKNKKANDLAISSLDVFSLENLPNELLGAYYDRPLSNNGKEIIYNFIDEGDMAAAELSLKDEYKISRFEPVKFNAGLTWKEDPYKEPYWRFNFYNLEPARNLLFAWRKTGNQNYLNKLINITESFIDNGKNGPYSWDYHGTAFRTLTLIDVFWKLREENKLPAPLGVKLMESLKVHGDFLADENHYEGDYNHGVDQATALYALAINFPNLPNAKNWRSLAEKRLRDGILKIIDTDGILVENSPYYHFYALEKYWEINSFLKKYNLSIGINFDKKINEMISYAAYILQPNLTTPTIGASLERKINLVGSYEEMARSNPNLLYVLTQGASGIKPVSLSKYYPDAGQTILRSGWDKGSVFENQTQVVFDVGEYRTDHSDLDALSFHLFGKGIALLPDAGLYTYEDGPYRSYFHGTASHNTVLVDGLDQPNIAGKRPKIIPGQFYEGKGFSYQSAQQTLYKGVTHERAIALIEDKLVLVVDNLISDEEHNYEQLFHAFPGAKINVNGETVKISGTNLNQTLTIRQLADNDSKAKTAIGQTLPVDGWCSAQYEKIAPCYAIHYNKKAKTTSFVTAIDIGGGITPLTFDKNKGVITAKVNGKEYQIKISRAQETPRIIEAKKQYDINDLLKTATIIDDLDNWQKKDIYGKGSVSFKKGLSVSENILQIETPEDNNSIAVEKDISLDLSDKNISFNLKISNRGNLIRSYMILFDGSGKTAVYDLKSEIYNTDYSNDWLSIGLGKGLNRSVTQGNWNIEPGFDWSQIKHITFNGATILGKTSTIQIANLSTIPEQKKGTISIVFDDGWSTVMKAAEIMKKADLKGTVAVITDSVNTKSYLTLNNLKLLQNDYGWSIANHSSLHKDAINFYYNENNLNGLDKDIGDAIQYLVENNINSAPNWYIYPNGRTNFDIKNIVGKYYKFARSTQDVPEFFPFRDPLAVKVFSVYSNRVSAEDVKNVISDAVKYKLTLILMFHSIVESPEVYTEFSINNFEEIIKNIADYASRQEVDVMTLGEMDKAHGIPDTKFDIIKGKPAQINLEISTKK